MSPPLEQIQIGIAGALLFAGVYHLVLARVVRADRSLPLLSGLCLAFATLLLLRQYVPLGLSARQSAGIEIALGIVLATLALAFFDARLAGKLSAPARSFAVLSAIVLVAFGIFPDQWNAKIESWWQAAVVLICPAHILSALWQARRAGRGRLLLEVGSGLCVIALAIGLLERVVPGVDHDSMLWGFAALALTAALSLSQREESPAPATNDVADRLRRAEELLAARDFAALAEQSMAGAARFPDEARFHYLAAVGCKLQRNYELAARYGEAARRLDPRNVKNLLNLADTYRHLRQPARAAALAEIILERAPGHAGALRLRELLGTTPSPR